MTALVVVDVVCGGLLYSVVEMDVKGMAVVGPVVGGGEEGSVVGEYWAVVVAVVVVVGKRSWVVACGHSSCSVLME